MHVKIKMHGYACELFRNCLHGRRCFGFSACFPAHEIPSEKGVLSKPKNTFEVGINSLSLE